MDEKTFEARVKKLEKLNEIIKKLDPAIRAEAFSLLRPYVTGGVPGGAGGTPGAGDNGDEAGAFFAKHTGEKPADNAVIVAAFRYSQYGSEPFSVDDIRQVAGEVGLTIPDRLDMTLRAAKRDGKALFRPLGGGKFKPTVHGETFFKKTYAVKKGTKRPPVDEQSST